MSQSGPRDTTAVISSRYTLTPAGYIAAARAQAAITLGYLEPLEGGGDDD